MTDRLPGGQCTDTIGQAPSVHGSFLKDTTADA